MIRRTPWIYLGIILRWNPSFIWGSSLCWTRPRFQPEVHLFPATKHLIRCTVLVPFPGPSVEQPGNSVNLMLAHSVQTSFLGEELPVQPIRIFICASLPRVVGMSKIHL